jgi:hypothetical protein
MNQPDSTAKNCGIEALELRTSEKNAIAELRLRSNISLKVAELRLLMCFLQVAELRLRTQKKVARAHLCLIVGFWGWSIGFFTFLSDSGCFPRNNLYDGCAEELAREVESGKIDPEQLVNRYIPLVSCCWC